MRSFIIALFVALLPASLLAQPLADKVPGDALIYIGWAGSESLGKNYQGSHLQAMLDASNAGELFSKTIPALVQRIGRENGNAGEANEMLRLFNAIAGPMWRHPSAFYFGGVDWPVGGQPTPKLALMCDAGPEANALLTQLNNILANVPKQGPLIQAVANNGLVVLTVGTLPAQAGEIKTLAAADAFGRAVAQVQKDSALALYVDARGLVKMVDAAVGRADDNEPIANWPKFRDALGLAGLTQAIWTSGFDGKDWMDQAFIGTTGERTGLLSFLSGEPLSADLLNVAPESSNRVIAGRFGIAKLVAQIRTGLGQVEPNAQVQFDNLLAQVSDTLGFNVQTDLLETIGDEWVAYTDPSVGGTGLLGFVIVNKLANPAKADESFTKVEQLANNVLRQQLRKEKMTVAVNQTRSGDITIHYLAIPFISPAWAIKDGNWYIGLYPQTVLGAADFVASKGKSILTNEKFAVTQSRLAAKGKPGAISYVDVPRTASDGYEEMLMMSRTYLGFADIFGAPTPAFILPPLAKVLPHLAPVGSVSWSDDAGWHAKSMSPFPGAGVFAGGGSGQMMVGQLAMMSSIMLPSLNRARETANRVKSASNLRMIGQGMLMYANENRGKYPPSFAELIKDEDMTAEPFLRPGSSKVPPPPSDMQALARWVNENAEYVYRGAGKKSSAPPDEVMAYEKLTPEDRDGGNILFGDGHVEWLNRAQFERMTGN